MGSSFALGQRFEALIRELVAAGRYNNASEVVRDGLRMLEERERRLATLDNAVAKGLADADAGRMHGIEETRARLKKSLRNADRKRA